MKGSAITIILFSLLLHYTLWEFVYTLYFFRSTPHILILYQMNFSTGRFKAWLMPFPYDSNQLAMKLMRLSIFLIFVFFFFHSNCYLRVNICELTLLPPSPGAYLKTSIFCYSFSLLLSWNGFLIIAYLRFDLNLLLFGNFYVTCLHSSLIQCNEASISFFFFIS